METRENFRPEVAAGQFVVFALGKEQYGVEVGCVREIIRVPEMIRVPRAPYHVEGVANLRGSILTVINGRSKFGLEKADYGDATRVLVLEEGSRVLGCVVDRVTGVVVVKPEEVEKIADADARSDFIRAVAKLDGGGRLVMLVDTGSLLGAAEESGAGQEAGGYIGDREDTLLHAEDSVEAQEEQMVSFRLGNEEYAVDISLVQEIVHIPEEISRPPNFPPYFEGLVTLRNRILPVVSLRALFRLERKQFDDRSRVVVLNIRTERGVHTVGAAVDAVAEVLRVPRSAVEEVPAVLRTQETEEILGVCKVHGGRRLVYILDPAKLFPLEELREFAGIQERDERIVAEATGSGDEEHLVTFQLNGQEYAVDIGRVQEIIRVPGVVSVPKAPEFVEGVINLRGAIIPVIDLRRRFGMPVKVQDEQARVVVVDIGGVRTGVRVDTVREVLKIPRRDVEPLSDLCAGEGVRFLRGVGKIEKAGRMIIILDIEEILSGREKQELAEMEEAV